MKLWTPEAEQRLETYLDEVLALAHSSGEPDDDFVDDLRAHIRSDVEQTADDVITPQRLERALAAVGTPRDVIGLDAPVYLSTAGAVGSPPAKQNGNGHAGSNGNGHATTATSPPTARTEKKKPQNFVWHTLGGIVLPIGAILAELFLITSSGGGGVGVMPTLLHLALIAGVPVGFGYLIHVAQRDFQLFGIRERRRVCLVIGYLYATTFLYSIALLPIVPFSFAAIIFFGLGMVGLSPIFAFICVAHLSHTFQRGGLYDAPYRRKTRQWRLIGALAVAVFLIGYPARQLWMAHHVEEVLHGTPASQMHSLRMLRTIGVPDISKAQNREQGLSILWTNVLRNDRYYVQWDRTRSRTADLQRVYFQVYGEAYQESGTRSPWYLENLVAPRTRQLREQGGEVVGAMIPGLTLASSTMNVNLVSDGMAEAGLGYTEWIVEFENKNPVANEARCVLALPPGGVASRLTLWINGEEREAAFGSTGQVKSAYQDVAVVRRQDPALLTNPTKGELFLQCFPVPAFGRMKVKIGVTAPLLVEDGTAHFLFPRILSENFGVQASLSHQVDVSSPAPVTANVAGLSARANGEEKHGLFGAVHQRDFFEGEQPYLTLVSPMVPGHYGGTLGDFEASMAVAPAESKAGRSVWLVVDGSAGVGAAEIDWASFIARFPEDTALHGVYGGFEVETWDGDGGRDGLVAWLEGLDFGFGQRLAPALAHAVGLSTGVDGRELIVIHGPQPYSDKATSGLAARLEQGRRGGAKTSVYFVPAAPGPNQLQTALNTFSEVEPVAVLKDVQQSLEHLAALGTPSDLVRTYTFARRSEAPEAAERHGENSQLVRLAALDRVLGLLRSSSPLETDEAVQIAKACRLVTPVTGAVVLENQEQYKRHGLDDSENLDAVPAVPEPGEWLLIGVGVCALAVVLRQRRAMQARGAVA